MMKIYFIIFFPVVLKTIVRTCTFCYCASKRFLLHLLRLHIVHNVIKKNVSFLNFTRF